MDFNQTLERYKYRLAGHCDNLDEAINHAMQLLSDSHKHEIQEALDLYHNTLIHELQNAYQAER